MESKNIKWIVVFSYVSHKPFTGGEKHQMIELEVSTQSAVEAVEDAKEVFWIDLVPNSDNEAPIHFAMAGSLSPIGVFPAPPGYVAGQ